ARYEPGGQMNSQWLNTLHTAIVAPHCVLCQAPATRAVDLWPACHDDLPGQRHGCRCCPLTLPNAAARGVCPQGPRRPSLAAAVATFRYEAPVDSLIPRLKFHRRISHARLLGTLMAARINAHGGALPDFILPVPLHARRYRSRGYNQA